MVYPTNLIQMKNKIAISFLLLSTLIIITQLISESNQALSFTSGPPAGRAGDPAGGNITCRNCHAGPEAVNVPNLITSNIPASGYIPGTTYTITATASGENRVKFGFQISPQNENGDFLGMLSNTSMDTQLNGETFGYINHTLAGTAGMNGSKTWTFNWTAPPGGAGPVTFYGAFNVTNNNNANTGDDIFVSRLTVNENISTSVNSVTAEALGVNLFPNPATEVINLEYTVQNAASVNIQLITLHGKSTQLFLSENHKTGKFTLPIMVDGLKTGIYFVKITVGNNTTTERFVIL